MGGKVSKQMRHKVVYPYEYMDNWEKFEETVTTTGIILNTYVYHHFCIED